VILFCFPIFSVLLNFDQFLKLLFVLLDLNFIWKKNECVLLYGPVGKCTVYVIVVC